VKNQSISDGVSEHVEHTPTPPMLLRVTVLGPRNSLTV